MFVERESREEIKLEVLNNFAWERVRQYQGLKIANFEVSTPFFSNDVALQFKQTMLKVGLSAEEIRRVFTVYNNNGISFGWYRGKGTPEQIAFAAEKIAKEWGLDLRRAATPEVIIEFMKAAGLGIDCSGFVYQTLKYAFDKTNNFELLAKTLNWKSCCDVGNEYLANIESFTGSASCVVNPVDIRPIDIIAIQDSLRQSYSHMALILEKDGKWMVAQSVIGQIPTGVHVHPFVINNNVPSFGFRPNLTERWGELYEEGRLEFRRLNIDIKTQ